MLLVRRQGAEERMENLVVEVGLGRDPQEGCGSRGRWVEGGSGAGCRKQGTAG